MYTGIMFYGRINYFYSSLGVRKQHAENLTNYLLKLLKDKIKFHKLRKFKLVMKNKMAS